MLIRKNTPKIRKIPPQKSEKIPQYLRVHVKKPFPRVNFGQSNSLTELSRREINVMLFSQVLFKNHFHFPFCTKIAQYHNRSKYRKFANNANRKLQHAVNKQR